MSDQSTKKTAADAQCAVRREPTEHYISGMYPSITRRSLLDALAFVCVLVGPIAVRAEGISVPSAAVVSVPSPDPTSPAASPPLPTVLRGVPASAARSVPTCPPGYILSGYACIRPSGGDRPGDGQTFASVLLRERVSALTSIHFATPPQ
jgi:hypothetical protein